MITHTHARSIKLNKVSVEPEDQPSHVSVEEFSVAAVVTFYRL